MAAWNPKLFSYWNTQYVYEDILLHSADTWNDGTDMPSQNGCNECQIWVFFSKWRNHEFEYFYIDVVTWNLSYFMSYDEMQAWILCGNLSSLCTQ